MDGIFSQNIPLFITIIALTKAFDPIERDMLFAILQHYGIPHKIISNSRQNSFTFKNSYNNNLLLPHECYKVIYQHHRDILCLKKICRRFLSHKGNNQYNSGRDRRSTARLADYKVNNLEFADKIALLEKDSTHSKRQLDKLEHEAKKVVLEITYH